MWPLRSIIYFILFWSGCTGALMNPIWGIINYMMVYQVNPVVTWWGKPLKDLGMRFSMLAAVFTLIGFLLARRKVPVVKPAVSKWEMGAILLVAIAAINLFTGHGLGPTTLFLFDKFWKVLLFVLVLTRMATTRKNLRLVVWTLVLGSLYLGYDAYTAPQYAFVHGRLDMIGGPDFSTTSGAAAHLVAMLPIIGVAFLTAKNWKWQAVAAIAGALTVNAVVLCRTRSAFIGFICGAVAAFLMTPRVRRYRIHILLAMGALGGLRLADDSFWTRMSTLTDREALRTDVAARSRFEIWEASQQILVDFPFGVGPGNFSVVIGQYDPRHYKRATHNSLVACFIELGIQGGVVFLAMAAGSLVLLYRSAKLAHRSHHPVETKLYAYGFFISFLSYFVTALGTQRLYCESFWWILCLPLCLHRMVVREARENGFDPSFAAKSRAPVSDTSDHEPFGRLQPAL